MVRKVRKTDKFGFEGIGKVAEELLQHARLHDDSSIRARKHTPYTGICHDEKSLLPSI